MIAITAGCTSEPKVVSVYHAGSLAQPFQAVEKNFEAANKNTDVQLEAAGSVDTIRKVTELGKQADVIGSADYRLIPQMMYPKYADWYIVFATNEIVLTYTDKSKYANEINADNWYEILQKPDVLWAFGSPNIDPCGYRTVMTIKLADFAYNKPVFNELLASHTAITIKEINGSYLITTPEALNPDTKYVTIRDKSEDLVSMTLAGGIDYAFEYRSVAEQNKMKYVELPPSINLKDVRYESTYAKVKVTISNGTIQTAAPIAYGITVPTNAVNKDLGIKYVEQVINENGQKIFRDMGQPPTVPALGSGNIPEQLKKYVEMIN
ncbi:MAG: tungstate ABC transporter substrate-binding protein WtpA [Candidatus Methanofastidiosa archaeon]|nr:tungstate ABC transporter substrate-binding protein WtpA [Candidatus Methanofastidiosa archaeon]